MVNTATAPAEDFGAAQTDLVRGTINGSLARDMMIGPFIVAFAVQVLGYSNSQITWFLSVIPLFILIRYPFLDSIRSFPRIRVIRRSRHIQLFCMIALLALPQDWLTVPVLIVLAILFVFGNEFLQNAVWMNLVTEVTDRASRGQFLGRLRTWKQATSMGFSLAGFFVVGDYMSRGEHRILLLIVIALLLNSLFWYRRLPAPLPPSSQLGFEGRGQFWRILQCHPLMRRPMWISFVIALLKWPILIVYVVGTLHLPANLLMLTTAASMLGAIVSEYAWGILADRRGIRRVFVIFFLGSALVSPLILLWPDVAQTSPGEIAWQIGTAALVAHYFLTGVLVAGQMMAMSMYRAHFLADRDGFHALNILTAIDQLFLASLTALGGVILLLLAGGSPGAGAFGAFDPFRIATVATMLATSALGLWFSRGIDLEDRT